MTTVKLPRATLRPSNLDKLALCSWFKGKPIGPPAKRGGSIDSLLRAYFAGDDVVVPKEWRLPFEYAIRETRDRARGHKILTGRKACSILVPDFPNPAECDAIIPDQLTSIDWKSGQEWDYFLQMAAYALGQMEAGFAVSWTAVLIYYDAQRLVWYRFTLEEARKIIADEKARYDFPAFPTPNQFCKWCANFDDCPAQRALAGYSLKVPAGALDFQKVKESPDLLGPFIAGCKAIRERYEPEARAAAVEHLLHERKVAGLRLMPGRKNYYVEPGALILAAKSYVDNPEAIRDGLEHIIHAAGPISKDAYEKLCGELGVTPEPSAIKQSPGAPFVQIANRKKRE